MPNRIPAFGILTRLAAASATAALVEGAALLFGWYSFVTSLSRRIVFFDPFDPDPAPPTFQDFLFADETRRFHFVTTNIAALVFAVMLISSFKVDFRETKSRARFTLLKLSTIAFSMVAIIAASNWISFRN